MTVRIITGGRDSGKTTWCRVNLPPARTAGVLLVKVISGGRPVGYDAERFGIGDPVPFMRIRSALPAAWDEADGVGRYSLSGLGLETACGWLSRAVRDPAADIVIDEVGRLELAGRGFSGSVRAALAPERSGVLYLVVRRAHVERVVRCFGLREAGNVGVIDVERPGRADTRVEAGGPC